MKITREFQTTSEIFSSPGHKSSGFLCFNVLIGSTNNRDIKSFFGPLDGKEIFIRLEEHQWANLLKTLGIFSSSSQARKNGWDKEIPLGWSEASFKKQRKIVFVFRQSPSRWQRLSVWLTKNVRDGIRTVACFFSE